LGIPKFLIQYHCSKHSVILRETVTNTCYTTSILQRQMHRLCC
jgi:hypothetical protein